MLGLRKLGRWEEICERRDEGDVTFRIERAEKRASGRVGLNLVDCEPCEPSRISDPEQSFPRLPAIGIDEQEGPIPPPAARCLLASQLDHCAVLCFKLAGGPRRRPHSVF